MHAYGHRLLFLLNRGTPRVVRQLSAAATFLAHPRAQIGLAAVAAVLLGKRNGLQVLAATVVGHSAAVAIGRAFPRERPWQQLPAVRVAGPLEFEPSFPSKHAATSFALASALGTAKPAWRKPALTLAALISLARVMQGQHFPTDVLAGAALGSSTAAALNAVI
jgi:membrane-associated phospholipid phosphatase